MAYFMQCFVLNFGSVELSYSTFYFKLNDLTVKGRIWFIETVQKITLHIQKLFQNNLPGIGSFHIYVGFVLSCLTIDFFFFTDCMAKHWSLFLSTDFYKLECYSNKCVALTGKTYYIKIISLLIDLLLPVSFILQYWLCLK